ncbi:MAG: type IV secretory pathway VirB10-like protein [Cocleimonas sp.]|jgi:type IV secretory pathway VirB10-like protein
MALIIKIAVLSMSILVLSACGGGGTNTDNGETPDPETPLTATDNPTPEPDISTPETDPPTSEPEVTIPEPETPTTEPEVPTTEPETTIPESEVTTPDPVIPPPSSGAVLVKNQAQAALFLNRATFGPTENDINNLLSKSTYENWVTEPFNTTTTYHLPDVKNLGR